MMRFRTFAFLVSILLSQPAMSQTETLLIDPPISWGAWKLASDQQGAGVHLTAWVPFDQEVSTWKESISIYIYESRPSGDVTTNVIRSMVVQANSGCESISIVPPKPQVEAGFVTAYAQVYCTKSKGTKIGRVDFLKAIASEHRVYLVIATKNVTPFSIPAPGAMQFANDEAETILTWMKSTNAYLRNMVRVCTSLDEKSKTCSSP